MHPETAWGCVSVLCWRDVKLPPGECKSHLGKLSVRVVDLAPMMDPRRPAGQAINLNLKLMRW
ncbi:hypothetical protein L227DRAFT_610958 [Lentinus tigrinus ALCF2SS1-6]|uniref:Uncharacterized protein n=1 Tax=Lentinus tigrinus ALCF2SS1-6 TaxID=1328759 RepID=A0A5C2SC80_9APHY|nr:hypothetical protein L227DRAFT_610958 [Lentinus tigrinus ALCF2SS1-6]